MQNLLSQALSVCRENGGELLTRIRIELGPLSGVEPALLRSAFELLRPRYQTEQAELVVDEIPLQGRCSTCDQLITIERFEFRCPDCGQNIEVTQGDQVRLISVDIREPLHDS